MASEASIDSLVSELRDLLEISADPEAADGMAAYMRDQFEFLGLRSPVRRSAAKPIVARLKGRPASDLLDFATACFAEPEREFHYVALDTLNKHDRVLDVSHLGALAELVTTNSWWDSIDLLAPNAIGRLALREPEAWEVIDAWIDHENFWLARSALLQQLKYKEQTDDTVLFDRCLRRADDSEFFIRKAIGWALRQYAYVDPAAVAAFVDDNRDQLSNLSIREATKNLK